MPKKDPEVVSADPEILEDEETAEQFLTKAKKFVAKLPFVRDITAFYYAVLDPKVPIVKKGMLAGAVIYFLSPIDLIPDFLGMMGFADDAMVAKLVLNTAQEILTEEHYRKADLALNIQSQPAPAFAARDVTEEEIS